tara:strand:- start:4314 stop:4589 length:276 start_codon:yes stop_codon:yes gene_type:complete
MSSVGVTTADLAGEVSEILSNSSLVRILDASLVTSLIGVFETNSGSPVNINDGVNEFELQVSDGRYGTGFNELEVPQDFRSAPFKPVFANF